MFSFEYHKAEVDFTHMVIWIGRCFILLYMLMWVEQVKLLEIIWIWIDSASALGL